MRSYLDLIKEGIIDFQKILLDKYYILGLTESECLVLLRLYQNSNKTNKDLKNILDLTQLKKTTSLDQDALGDIVAKLVSKGFITLNIDESNGTFTESYSLEETYKELAYVLENNDVVKVDNETSIQMKKTVKNIEVIVKKMLTPFELEMIKKWYYDYKYEQEKIINAIAKVSKMKSPSVQAIDRVLYSDTHTSIDENDISKAQEILKRKYGKK